MVVQNLQHLSRCIGDSKTTQPGAAVLHVHGWGTVFFWKVAKNFGQCAFLSAREIEHGQFRALFAGMFCRKIQNG
jgi:hypothetical protein